MDALEPEPAILRLIHHGHRACLPGGSTPRDDGSGYGASRCGPCVVWRVSFRCGGRFDGWRMEDDRVSRRAGRHSGQLDTGGHGALRFPVCALDTARSGRVQSQWRCLLLPLGTFDPAHGPGIRHDDAASWAGYVYAGDFAVYAADDDRSLVQHVLRSARASGEESAN